jgi:serine/threonine protein kinase
VRSDLYSLGAVGYFLLTGTTVFTGTSLMEICRKQVDAIPEPPSQRLGRTVDPDLEALILRCLAKRPSDRPAGAEELAQALWQCTAAGAWTTADARSWWESQSDTQSGENAPPSTIASGYGKTIVGPVSTG